MMEQILTEESVSKTMLKGLTLKELKDFFTAAGEKRFRGDQVFEWIYMHMAENFDDMSTIPNYLRKKLNLYCELNTLTIFSSEQSQRTGTKKYLFKTHDDLVVESVVIPDPKRITLCISTQVGCPLDCQFCATGLMGYKRNLSSAEIMDQFLMVSRDYGKNKISNIVYMGMGEPLLNYANTLKTLQIFAEEKTKDISLRRITVSTAGIAPKIIELADSGLKVKLALSLHSMFEERKPDLIISGINKGSNMGEDITYSGTAAAAMEGVLQGVPSIAISQVMDFTQPIGDFTLAKKAIRHLAEKVLNGNFPLKEREFLNVNIPYDVEELEFAVTYAGYRYYGNDAHLHRNPRGMEYYWLGLHPLEFKPREKRQTLCDFEAIEAGKVSLTPIKLDMSAYKSMQQLREWL